MTSLPVTAQTIALTEEDLATRTALEQSWAYPRGFIGWLKNTSHLSVGKRYIVTAFVFFILGGLEAGLMRLQLSRPENSWIGPDLYNQIFTMHGTTMMFLFAVPMMTAVGLYIVPLMIGTRNVSSPRLNLYGYYTFVIGGAFLYISFFLNIGPDAGWFSYPPLSGPQYSPGKRIDVWAQTITFTEIAALVAAVVIITTVFKQRAPGMSLNRIPLFVWAMLVTMFMVVFSMPWVATASQMLAADRLVDTHFFNAAEGGDAILWQHLFWFFGHPEVYIIFIPALGMVSSIVETFTGRPIFGYPVMVLSLITTAFMGFGLWVHHMFATPIPQLGQSFFTGASSIIAIPTGVQIFCWIATIWAGKPRFTTPFLFIIGFIVTFVIGGVTGVMLASVPFNLQTHDTYFVVAHFHYVLIGGGLFPLFGAFYYWFPKFTGRMMSERMGKVNFWLFFVGVNLTFFPMHILGFEGMTRRIYTYLPETGWGPLNLLSSIGAVIIVLSVVTFLVNVFRSWRAGVPAGENPWNAASLEWATDSPPPPYVFLHVPVCVSEHPLWEEQEKRLVVKGLRTDIRENLMTTLMDADPDHRHDSPNPNIWPFVAALSTGVMFIMLVFTVWALVVGAILLFPPLVMWGWPSRSEQAMRLPGERDPLARAGQ